MMNVRYIMRGVLWLVGSLLLTTACSEKQEMPGEEVDVTSRMLNLSLSVASSSAEGNTLNGGYEEGVGLENVIDIAGGNYRIYFFSAGEESTYIGTFQPTLFTRVPVREEGQPTGTYVYHFMGKIPDGVGTTFKLVVLGNWRGYPVEENKGEGWLLEKGKTTIPDLCGDAGAQYTHLSPDEEGNWLNSKSLIPFYGVREYDVVNYASDLIENGKIKEGAIVNLESDPVPMLRAVARVEVIFNNRLFTDFDKQIEIHRYNESGFCGPKNALNYNDYVSINDDGSLKWDWTKDFIRAVHLVDGQNDNEFKTLSFTKVSNLNEQTNTPEKWVAYVPEYKNIGEGEKFSFIQLSLPNVDESPTSQLYFANYNDVGTDVNRDENRLNIERNNIYRFTITGSTANLQCHLDIQPYAECKLEMDYGLMRDEDGDLMIVPDDKGNLPKFFTTYMQGKEYPKEEGNSEELKRQKGDYYAIHLKSDGLLSNADIWLKDADSCRVLTNFAGKQNDLEECQTRKVIYNVGLTQKIFNKDRDHDRLLQHNDDHSSVVLDPEGKMIYKKVGQIGTDGKPLRLLVESWDETTGFFWVEEGDFYVKGNRQGFPEKNPEGEAVKIQKTTTNP